MPSLPRIALCFGLLASLVACGADGPESDVVDSRGVGVSQPGSYAAAWPSLFVRGTMNGWDATPMQLVGDHDWSVEVTTGASDKESFKLDVHGDWRVNFGDNDGDQTAERSGKNIPLPSSRTVVIHFNDQSSFYWVEERTWQAEVSVNLPAGIDAWAMNQQRANLTLDGEPYGWNFIYVDSEHGAPYVPVSGLSMGTEATLSFDSIVAGKRLVGEVTWVVDGSEDPIAVQMDLAEASLENFGAVELTVFADRWENGQMVSGPFSNVGVFLGDWQAGNMLGYTGDAGTVFFMVPGGDHTISTMVMTSSHSIASGSMPLSAQAGSLLSTELHMAPITVSVAAHYDTGVGRALYITGDSDYLGNWKTASRMTWNGGAWTYQRNLPIGLPFKIVLAPWSDDSTISTAGVTWEKGPNRVVTPPNGYVSSEIAVHPSF
jgi:hypothetical protein